MKNITTSRSKNGFTLVELLVVIAVIALLIAIAVPVLGKAKERSRLAACMSNLRQISVATQNQFDDLSGKLPYREKVEHFGFAAGELKHYLGGETQVFRCPSNQGIRENDNTKIPDTTPEQYTHYELNGYLAALSGKEGRRQNGITDSSQAAIGFDFPYDPASVERAHRDGVNVGYLDGHAAWLADEDMGPLAGSEDDSTFFRKGHDFEDLF